MPLTLRERKQQKAREQIIDAAYALFAERGFGVVTVTDIAERADVGRTTFFRHFGDKQEVLFADEQEQFDRLAAERTATAATRPATLAEALRQLEPVVLGLCAVIVADTDRYQARERLIDANPELQDRQRRKSATLTAALEEILLNRGTPEPTARLAAHVAGACYHASHLAAGGHARELLPAIERAFADLRDAGPA